MLTTRVIPCLLLSGQRFVKTTRFKDPTYLGDPINIVKIFNDKEVDELAILDISATLEHRAPAFDYLARLASEAFVPVMYGGGVRTLDDMQRLFSVGIEKVAINSAAVEHPSLIRRAADRFGSQSVVVSVDVKRRLWGGYEVRTHGGQHRTGVNPVHFARQVEESGAGELLLNAIDRDGTMAGYDLSLLRQVSDALTIPLIACGGAGSVEHLTSAIRIGGASAAAAGSMFVFQGPHRAVLISYPARQSILNAIGE